MLKRYEDSKKYWDPMGSILPCCLIISRVLLYVHTGLGVPERREKEEVESFIDDYCETKGVEKEVEI